MSIQSARDFLTKVSKDEEFRTRLGGCKTGADRIQFAQGAGFEFTGDEIRAAGSELQDADLDVVSGGCCDPDPVCPTDSYGGVDWRVSAK